MIFFIRIFLFFLLVLQFIFGFRLLRVLIPIIDNYFVFLFCLFIFVFEFIFLSFGWI